MALFEILALAGLMIAIVSAALHLKSDSLLVIARRLRQVESEIADLSDRTNTWMKRDSVRHAREKKAEQAELEPLAPELARYAKKAQIRARAKAGRQLQ